MATKYEEYRGYKIALYAPKAPRDRWRAMIWRPGGTDSLFHMPLEHTEAEVLNAARTEIDRDISSRDGSAP